MTVVHSAVPSRYRPSRDRGVNALVVACPVCASAIGEACVTVGAKGAAVGAPTGRHPGRRRLAVRLDNSRRLDG